MPILNVNRTDGGDMATEGKFEILDFVQDQIHYATTEKAAIKLAISLPGAFIMRRGEVVAVWKDRKFKAYGEIFRLIEQNEPEIITGSGDTQEG